MNYTLKKEDKSNYQIIIVEERNHLEKYRSDVVQKLEEKRNAKKTKKGNLKKINSAYIELGIFEEFIHESVLHIVKENSKLKFIGNIYDLGHKEDGDNIEFKFYLDVYPTVLILNEDWKQIALNRIDSNPTEEELEDTLYNLKQQYASYSVSDIVTLNSIITVKYKFIDSKNFVIDSGIAYLEDKELNTFAILKENLEGKYIDDKVKISYNESDLPQSLIVKEKSNTVHTLELIITKVSTIKLPTFDESTLNKLFGDEVKTLEDLKYKVSSAISHQKFEALLMDFTEDYLCKVKKSFEITIPQTLVKEEFKSRMESLEQRYGGKQKLDEYINKIGKKEFDEMCSEIKSAAINSLEKFFILRELTDRINLLLDDEDWKTPLNVERKLYDYHIKVHS